MIAEANSAASSSVSAQSHAFTTNGKRANFTEGYTRGYGLHVRPFASDAVRKSSKAYSPLVFSASEGDIFPLSIEAIAAIATLTADTPP